MKIAANIMACLVLCLITGCRANNSIEVISTGTLLYEMIDLGRLTYLPEAGYKTIQLSSFDRRSTIPGKPGWFQNSDGFGREPLPGFEETLSEPDSSGTGRYLICDIDKPGVMVRTWTAMINGTLTVWLDNLDEPVYEGAAEDFLWNTAAALAGGERPEYYETIFRQNDACYFPVAFRKRLRIEWVGDIDKLHFYQIQVRLYTPGTNISSFSSEEFHTCSDLIDSVAGIFGDPQANYPLTSGNRMSEIAAIGPDSSQEIIKITGQGQIESFFVRVEAADMTKALRQTLLNISFDGASVPQVHSPLGDFFGAAPGINPYQSLPFTVMADGLMSCRFPMPFRDSVSVVLDNRSGMELKIEYGYTTTDYEWVDNSSLHFHAKWRIDHDLNASNTAVQDIPYLVAMGRGRFAGVSAYILNPSEVPSSWGNWWGEGDEKIFVDDDIIPSVFGTGSEDYFNYSWSSGELFDHLYCGQPRNDGPANRGFVTNYRFQILDDIPFYQRIAFFMELYHHGRVDGFAYGRIAYYYATPETIDDNMMISDDDLREQKLPHWDSPVGYLGSANSEFFEAEDVITVYPADRLFPGELWTGGQIIYYEFSRKGETLPIRVPVTNEANIRVHLTMAHTCESGKVKLFLENHLEETQIITDLHSDHAILSRNHSLNRIHLSPGTERVLIENMEDGPNRVGIDFIWVQY